LTGFVNVSQYNKICSDRLQATLENTKGYGTLFNNSDSLDLLEMIKEVMFTQKERKNLATPVVETQLQLIGLKQYDLSVQKYRTRRYCTYVGVGYQ
jgi:hypothetical protein